LVSLDDEQMPYADGFALQVLSNDEVDARGNGLVLRREQIPGVLPAGTMERASNAGSGVPVNLLPL
jgi:hypothetical protein